MVDVACDVRDSSGTHVRSADDARCSSAWDLVDVQRRRNRSPVVITGLSSLTRSPSPISTTLPLQVSSPLPTLLTDISHKTQLFTMGFLSFFRRASANHATAAEDQGEYSDEKDTASAKRFLSSFCCISWGHTTDAVEEQQEKPKPRDKPPKYNRHNLPSMVIEDPPPWVTNYRKLERRSDGELFVTSLPHAEQKPGLRVDNLPR